MKMLHCWDSGVSIDVADGQVPVLAQGHVQSPGLYQEFQYVVAVAHWHHMAALIWVNIGSSNSLSPDGTEPLPEPMLTYHQVFCDIRLISVSQKKLMTLIRNLC